MHFQVKISPEAGKPIFYLFSCSKDVYATSLFFSVIVVEEAWEDL